MPKGEAGIVAMPPAAAAGGRITFDWATARIVPCKAGPPVKDVLAEDGRFTAPRISTGRHDVGPEVINSLECYDEAGRLLWARQHNDYSIMSLQSLGGGLISILDRGWMSIGPVAIRTKDGDLASQVFCREASDCWSHTALRLDADTAMVGIVQTYKVSGLSSVKSAAATVDLPGTAERRAARVSN